MLIKEAAIKYYQQPADDISMNVRPVSSDSGCYEDFRGKILLLYCAISKE